MGIYQEYRLWGDTPEEFEKGIKKIAHGEYYGKIRRIGMIYVRMVDNSFTYFLKGQDWNYMTGTGMTKSEMRSELLIYKTPLGRAIYGG